MSSLEILIDTDLDLPLISRGKVRDVYEIAKEQLLLVATDRISAFDVVMNEGIPQKGKITFYKKRLPEDNELSSKNMINHLRACEKNHPAFFYNKNENTGEFELKKT